MKEIQFYLMILLQISSSKKVNNLVVRNYEVVSLNFCTYFSHTNRFIVNFEIQACNFFGFDESLKMRDIKNLLQ